MQQQGSFTPEQIAELQRHVGYGATWLGPVLVAGKGSRVTDIDGKSYIDCTAQAWTLALGYNHPEVTEAALAQMQALPHVRAGFPTLPRLLLAKRLATSAGVREKYHSGDALTTCTSMPASSNSSSRCSAVRSNPGIFPSM